MNYDNGTHQLIVTIVPKGAAEKIIRASLEAGAEGGTVMYGRGVGIHEKRTLLGIPIEPEKEILLTVVPNSLTRTVMASMIEAGELDLPGNGIAFALSLAHVAGVCHLMQE